MISEELFRKTEGRLYRHYRQLREIEKLKHRVQFLNFQKERIRLDLRETNVYLVPESRSIEFGERVQSSPTGESYAEKSLMREITILENEWKNVRRRIVKNNIKMREMEAQASDMEFIIKLFNEEGRRFIHLRYYEANSLDAIAKQLNMSKATASRARKEIIEKIAKWNNI
ncbi:MAG: hypothetical protein AB6733_00170 [Clostridiaceae bacterium]